MRTHVHVLYGRVDDCKGNELASCCENALETYETAALSFNWLSALSFFFVCSLAFADCLQPATCNMCWLGVKGVHQVSQVLPKAIPGVSTDKFLVFFLSK